jgi:hypothetical protein
MAGGHSESRVLKLFSLRNGKGEEASYDVLHAKWGTAVVW